jgi:hypothetical protein
MLRKPGATYALTVKPVVALPVVADAMYCVGVQATALTATGTRPEVVQCRRGWQSAAGSTRTVDDGGRPAEYYVSQTVDGCESPRAKVTVTVKAATDAVCACNLVAFASSNPVSCRDDQDGVAIAVVQSGGSGKYEYKLLDSPRLPEPGAILC